MLGMGLEIRLLRFVLGGEKFSSLFEVFDLTETSSISGAGRSILSLRVIVGIIIGMLLLVLLGVAIAAALFCLVRKRKAGGKYSTGRVKKENVHYGVGKLW